MVVIKSAVILTDKEGRILLQLRDEEPYKDTWVLFGGSVEEGETDEEAAIREIKEELHFDVKDLTFFKRTEFKGVEQPTFIYKNPVKLSDLTLDEGADLRFFSEDELDSIEFGFNYGEIVRDYFDRN